MSFHSLQIDNYPSIKLNNIKSDWLSCFSFLCRLNWRRGTSSEPAPSWPVRREVSATAVAQSLVKQRTSPDDRSPSSVSIAIRHTDV
ncbi:hypothetical protein TNCT_524791 [Trichonephila clavata]|uniref:Uncharacterized protein n=1 Tax=Trichonephila clavata TaxID=2740835 RepID=A0A8X6HQM8_TRICU|nr:hypothetical protein TNCT_524791 [Trichonephila clavata]